MEQKHLCHCHGHASWCRRDDRRRDGRDTRRDERDSRPDDRDGGARRDERSDRDRERDRDKDRDKDRERDRDRKDEHGSGRREREDGGKQDRSEPPGTEDEEQASELPSTSNGDAAKKKEVGAATGKTGNW